MCSVIGGEEIGTCDDHISRRSIDGRDFWIRCACNLSILAFGNISVGTLVLSLIQFNSKLSTCGNLSGNGLALNHTIRHNIEFRTNRATGSRINKLKTKRFGTDTLHVGSDV